MNASTDLIVLPIMIAGFIEKQSLLRKPSSPWMPFPMPISELSKTLPAHTVKSISKCHKDYKVSCFSSCKHSTNFSFQSSVDISFPVHPGQEDFKARTYTESETIYGRQIADHSDQIF